jgi:hypothetical protein
MKTLKSIPSNLRYREDFSRIGDLVNFEGPELSVFERKGSQEIFVFDWVDHDDSDNRWLLFEVQAKDVLEFIFRKITHLQLFNRANPQGMFCLEINNEKGFSNLPVFQLLEIPTDYFPNPVLFERQYCPDFDRILNYLHNRVSIKKNVNQLPKLSRIEFEHLLPKDQVYHSNSLARAVRLWAFYNNVLSVALREELMNAQIRGSSDDERYIPNSLTPHLKSYGFSNAS